MAQLDMKTLQAVCAETEQLWREGTLTQAKFRDLCDQAKVAAGDHPEMLEALAKFAQSSWLS